MTTRKIHLLIVSPSPLYAEAIAISLRTPLLDVSVIDSTQCIIDRCLDTRVELIIFLALAPYFTSMNVVEYLRIKLKKVPPIYVISHSYSQSTILTLLECGVSQYMTFPINLYRLRNKVFNLISQ